VSLGPVLVSTGLECLDRSMLCVCQLSGLVFHEINGV
jgi:hypothetical protein